ncbi:unnamed protein product [Eruca vesicaria subsp. sativa]|uniref:Uncharacterized protein n=1 Tax=Eruca vesicaria subsp. sativa TaxID=29727 RepID=A0ABC8LI05_ERUVS|nr:unnamed protein product [Eruca vesicaria subsp. sativa]
MNKLGIILQYKNFAYDGEKTLFTVGPLPQEELDFSVVLEDKSSSKSKTKTFNVVIRFATKISSRDIKSILQGDEPNELKDAVRAMDAILRQNAATRNCLLVRQSFFDTKYLLDHFEGVQPCRGFHSSFRPTQNGLSLNMDVSTTLLVRAVPVINFLVENQRVNRPSLIDWKKQNQANGVDKKVEVTVYNYFTKLLRIELRDSGDLRCINVGKLTRPTYIPIELCELLPLQRYTKALTSSQRSKMVTASEQNPRDKLNMLNEVRSLQFFVYALIFLLILILTFKFHLQALQGIKYNDDPMLKECGVRISSNFTEVEGRILAAPKLLKAGNGLNLFPKDGRWNFRGKEFAEPATFPSWAVVNFSRGNPHSLVDALIKLGREKGMKIPPSYEVFEEDNQLKSETGTIRVQKMFESMKKQFNGAPPPNFIICILSERKNSDVYGPWKKRTLFQCGIVSQCIAYTSNTNEHYLTNVLLKINVKFGGLNSLLTMDCSRVTTIPTIVIGMDVCHGSTGSNVPSIAAVVSSTGSPGMSKYRAFVRTQSPRLEMIANLFDPVHGSNDDHGIMSNLLLFLLLNSKCNNNECRDGVSESQFAQVLTIELEQIRKACKLWDENWSPKFTVIISVKRHHTRFFQSRSRDKNVPPGTIVDSGICSPYRNNFYLCAHTGMLGTSRPIHYHVLYDDIGFTTDELQKLVHSLSYAYQRSTSAISQVAPVMYAHLAAAQMATAMSFEDNSETSSSHGGATTSEQVPVPVMPKLHSNVAKSMFFC